MAIYGTALLSACVLAGLFAGRVLGELVGIQANVGGVGIAMLLLILGYERLHRRGKISSQGKDGVMFWSSLYIPVVVAMAASQNVVPALDGGVIALIAGLLSVALGFLLVPCLARNRSVDTNNDDFD
ncbi:malonate transporter subunit MadL [Endozoicomonadaceae bacterium StTr2]